MLRIIKKYKVWRNINRYIKYYKEHTNRDIPYIPFYKIKVQNKKNTTYCFNEFNNDIYIRLIFISFNNIQNEEILDNNIKYEVSHYICNEVYRLHYTEIYNDNLPQFKEIRNIFK